MKRSLYYYQVAEDILVLLKEVIIIKSGINSLNENVD